MLVREVVRLAPLGVILLAAGWDAPLQAALDLLATNAPRPVLVVGAAEWPADADLLLRSHVMAWLPGALDAALLAAAWPVARAHFDHQQALRAAAAATEARLDERKWVDRAKGVLMRHQQLSEVDAFTLLRTASMHANLRVVEVSRGLIEAAQAADALNRVALHPRTPAQIDGPACRSARKHRLFLQFLVLFSRRSACRPGLSS